MLIKNQEKLENKTVKAMIEATENLTESPIVEYFYNNPDKNPSLSGYRLVFDTKTKEFSIHFGFVDYDVTDKMKNEIVLHIFQSKDNQAKLINGPVKNFQIWMMETVIPNYQNTLFEFVDGVDQPRELGWKGLNQVRADKKLVIDFARLGTQFAGLRISWRDMKFSTLLYSMIFTVYYYTKDMNCPDDDYLPNIDNVVKAVRWAIKENGLFDSEKTQVAKMLKWIEFDFTEFFYSDIMRDNFEKLENLVE